VKGSLKPAAKAGIEEQGEGKGSCGIKGQKSNDTEFVTKVTVWDGGIKHCVQTGRTKKENVTWGGESIFGCGKESSVFERQKGGHK